MDLRDEVLGGDSRSSNTRTENTGTRDEDAPTCTDDREADAEADAHHRPCVRRSLLEKCPDVECLPIAYRPPCRTKRSVFAYKKNWMRGRKNVPVRSMYRPMAERVVRPEPEASANVDTMTDGADAYGPRCGGKEQRCDDKVVGASHAPRRPPKSRPNRGSQRSS